MNPSDLLGGQPIQEMAPSIRGIREAPGTHSVVAARHARVERIFGNIDNPISRQSLFYPSTSCIQQELRIEQPCTQDLRSRVSQDTVQSEQRSLENGA